MMKVESSSNEKFQYFPENNNLKGIAIASTIIIAYIICWYHALFQIDLNRSAWWDILITFLLMEFLYTGLFITCHDAMHGGISPRFRRLNNLLGYLAISIYAWFDYDIMYEKHWRHHKHTGIVKNDPDYHNGRWIGFFPWYLRFMIQYLSVKQMIKMLVWVHFLMLVLLVPLNNIYVFMLGCGVISSFRLFYFGTYLPHRPDVINGKFEETMPWEKSRSSNGSRLITFLSCYHFGYHWEHHRWPYVPWWDLWKCKDIRQKNAKSTIN